PAVAGLLGAILDVLGGGEPLAADGVDARRDLDELLGAGVAVDAALPLRATLSDQTLFTRTLGRHRALHAPAPRGPGAPRGASAARGACAVARPRAAARGVAAGAAARPSAR